MRTPKLAIIHTLNTVFLIGAGGFLHFAFDLSEENILVAPFAALDESVWEHGKLLFWPAVLLALGYGGVGICTFRRLALATATGTLTAIALMFGGFYGYTALLGDNLLALDLTLFVVCVICGYAMGWKFFRSSLADRNPVTGYVLLAALIISFSAFSFWKPPFPIFHQSVQAGQADIARHIVELRIQRVCSV